jgi:hypothetical protein
MPSRSRGEGVCARTTSAPALRTKKGPGPLLARKRWILREADFTLGPAHKRAGYATW